MKSELINMTRVWDKETFCVPDRNRTHDFPNTRRKKAIVSSSLLTFLASFLSAFLTITCTTIKHRRTTEIVTITATFPVSWRLLNSTVTLSKSMGFGLIKRAPPNEVRWLQEQLINPLNVADNTWEKINRKKLKSN